MRIDKLIGKLVMIKVKINSRNKMNENSSNYSRKSKIWEKIYQNFEEQVIELNTLYSHQVLKGEENEKAFKDFCESFLPSKFKIEKNKVLLDKDGKESTEQDIVIWNSHDLPRIFTSMDRYFLFESVLMCIEIKTTLDKKKLEKTLLKIKNLRNLNYFKRLDGEKQWQIHPPLCFIFAYACSWKKRGSILKTITDIIKLNDIKPSERFDFLYIMRKGISLSWDIPVQFSDTGFAIRSLRERYRGNIPYNERWPQFFPSKLIKEIPLELSENQIHEVGSYNERFLNDLNTNEQIYGMISFLSELCRALEDQKTLHSQGQIVFSYFPLKITDKRGLNSPKPF